MTYARALRCAWYIVHDGLDALPHYRSHIFLSALIRYRVPHAY